ncbi:MAG: S1C family serine protease [Haloarculaceae archaeon]
MERERLSRRGFLAAAGLSAVLAGCNAPSARRSSGAEPAGSERTDLINQTPASAPSAFSRVYRGAIDSVVLIRVYDGGGPRAEGTGFVFDGDHVVTNQHVVAGSTDVEVRFADDAWRTATVAGTDIYSDLAVLGVDDVPDSATPLALIDGEVAVGQRVAAIGNPFGLSGSLSAGIVSGVDRLLPGPNDFRIPDAIQTDAAVNPGNSGGPLMTLDGEVAGVVNAVRGDNVGFAISAALTRRVAPALIDAGEYHHSYMGVRLMTVTPLVARANDLDRATGVYIASVMDGGPADGVLEGSTVTASVRGTEVPVGGDVVTRLGGERIRTQAALSTYLALSTSPGKTIPVGVVRDGRETTVDLTLGRRPPV